MGGIGSGRRDQSGKATTSDCRAIDVRRLQRDGLIAPGILFEMNWMRNGETEASIRVRTEFNQLTLIYRHRRPGDDWQDREYPVKLDWIPCNYGGRRAWFICPAKGCGRRVAKLYLGSAGIFACRHCNRLVYSCQRETPDDRAAHRADKIRARLGWNAGILNNPGGKPKGMHWRTFARLTRQHDAFVNDSLAGMMKRFERMDLQLDGLWDDLNGMR